ncbi:MAG: carboxypeptidase-like regulatory domain-containing protein [Bacteroidaceae bacterium]|nr:carboxypeptidase-like regulatory domain-containing protein [Bacteroidaceae bacterium]
MKQSILFLIVSLMLTGTLNAQQHMQVRGRVVDDATGEELPSVSIYVRDGQGAITNFDGDFSFLAAPDDMLRFSYIGYEKLTLPAASCPAVVRMKPLTVTMSEVMVRSGTNLLELVAARLTKEWKSSRRKSGNYFYRLSSVYSRRLELAESFIKARSAINLRDLRFLRGLRGQFSDRGFDASLMDSTNQHFLTALAPMTHEAPFWDDCIIPLNDLKQYQTFYDTQVEELTDEDGTIIYRIHLSRNDRPMLHIPYLEGTFYVAQKNLRLLRFEGDMRDLQIKVVGGGRSYMLPIDVHLNIVYRVKRRSTLVNHMAVRIQKDFLTTRSMLFNIDDVKFRHLRGKSPLTNMLHSIDEAGYDSTLWAVSNIVMRTNEEEAAAFSDSTGFMPDLSDRRLDPVLLNVRRMLIQRDMLIPLRPSKKEIRKEDEDELLMP